MRTCLVIDDELTPATGLGAAIDATIRQAGLLPRFARTWNDPRLAPTAREILASEHVVLVLLDVMFPGQLYEGADILAELQRTHPSLPIVVLTQRDVFTEAQELLERGATRYLVKHQLQTNLAPLQKLIQAARHGPNEDAFDVVLHARQSPSTTTLFVEVYDEDAIPLLRRPRRTRGPLARLLITCALSQDHAAYYDRVDDNGCVLGLEPWTRVDVQRRVWNFNRSIHNLSDGRIHVLLKGLGIYGASAFRLLARRVRLLGLR